MPLLQVGQTTTVSVPIGQIMILTGSAGVGNVVPISNPGGDPGTPVPFAGVQKAFGPYDVLSLFRVNCTRGEMFVDVSPASIAEAGLVTVSALNGFDSAGVALPPGYDSNVVVNTSTPGTTIITYTGAGGVWVQTITEANGINNIPAPVKQ